MPPRKPAPVPAYTDFIQPFLIDRSAIRGRLVRLEDTLDAILTAHNYAKPVSLHLAEQIVLTALLGATLSGDGVLTLQAKGEGPIKFIVADMLAGGAIRGYADVDDNALKKSLGKSKAKLPPLSKILGKGYLAVTLNQGGEGQNYQGIVDLSGDTFSEALQRYFTQSQQQEITVHVAIEPPSKTNKKWRGGGIIVERIPLEGGKESESTDKEQEELWKRTVLFTSTIKDKELLDPDVTPQNLLYRLFNEDGVWVYKVQPLKHGCRCSRDRVKTVLKSFGKEEVMSLFDEKGKISVHCQFCNKLEAFTKADIAKLFSAAKKKPAKKK